MKLKGINLKEKPYDEITVNVLGNPVNFKAGVVTDYKEFDAVFPEPKPPIRVSRDGSKTPHVNDPSYKKKSEERGVARMIYMLMKSLTEYSDMIEWQTLTLEDVSTLTFDNLMKEFLDAGVPEMTANKVINLAMSANGLTEKLVDAARETFLPEAPEEQDLSPE